MNEAPKSDELPAELTTPRSEPLRPAGVDDVTPLAVLDQGEPVAPPKLPAHQIEREVQPAPSKFQAALLVVSDEQSGIASGKSKEAKQRKTGGRKKSRQRSATRVETAPRQSKILNVKDKRIMASQPSFQKANLPEIVADVQDKAVAVYEKGTQIAGKVGELVKSSAGAVAASGKTLGTGAKEIGANSFADGRQALATFGDDLKELAAIKSPSELLRFQGKLAGRNLDAAVALTTKNTQAFRDLAGMAFAPLFGGAKANMEAIRK